jgi:hypothetical protein
MRIERHQRARGREEVEHRSGVVGLGPHDPARGRKRRRECHVGAGRRRAVPDAGASAALSARPRVLSPRGRRGLEAGADEIRYPLREIRERRRRPAHSDMVVDVEVQAAAEGLGKADSAAADGRRAQGLRVSQTHERCLKLFALPAPDFAHEDATDGATCRAFTAQPWTGRPRSRECAETFAN